MARIPLTSKVAIVSRSTLPCCDVDFLFAQVAVDKDTSRYDSNCGNILAGVAPFALERGLVKTKHPATRVKVRTLNTAQSPNCWSRRRMAK